LREGRVFPCQGEPIMLMAGRFRTSPDRQGVAFPWKSSLAG
jgi:hypothetical protein